MKTLKEKIDSEREVVLCADCLEEVEYGQNDWDSFEYCDKCEKDTFLNNNGKLKTIYAKRQEITRYIKI